MSKDWKSKLFCSILLVVGYVIPNISIITSHVAINKLYRYKTDLRLNKISYSLKSSSTISSHISLRERERCWLHLIFLPTEYLEFILTYYVWRGCYFVFFRYCDGKLFVLRNSMFWAENSNISCSGYKLFYPHQNVKNILTVWVGDDLTIPMMCHTWV